MTTTLPCTPACWTAVPCPVCGNYDLPIDHPHGLRAELVQVAASAIGWLACLPLPTVPPAAQLDGQTDILEELR